MTSRIRLALVALLLAAGLGAGSPASADPPASPASADPPASPALAASPVSAGPPAPACPSHDDLAARLRAEGFRAPAANNFARLTVRDCATHES